jgi:hypothetical protein
MKNCVVQNNKVCEPVGLNLFRGRENAPANTAGALFQSVTGILPVFSY